MTTAKTTAVLAAIACLLCGGMVRADLEIIAPGYYAGNYCAASLNPVLEWYDSSPSRFARYRVEFGELKLYGSFTPIWTASVMSKNGVTDYSVVYDGPSLSNDAWYCFTVTKVSLRKTEAEAFDYFVTSAPEITDIEARAEYVTIENDSSYCDVDMTNWRLKDKAGHSYYFPSFTLGAGDLVRVHTGTGTDDEDDLYMDYDNDYSIWNNDGDTGYLYDDNGDLISTYSY